MIEKIWRTTLKLHRPHRHSINNPENQFNQRIFRLFPLLLIALAIFCGKDSTVESIPDGADVFRDGKKIGTTPFTINLGKGETVKLNLQKEGYIPKDMELYFGQKEMVKLQQPYVNSMDVQEDGAYRKMISSFRLKKATNAIKNRNLLHLY